MFLLHAPTMGVAVPPRVAVKSVGEPPKSESEPCAVVGTAQASSRASVDALSLTTDTESPPGP